MAGIELSPEAAQLKDDGNKLYVIGAYGEALETYTRALALAPKSAILLSNLSATYLALKDWAKALQFAEECLVTDPAFLKAYGRKAAAQMGLIRPGDAEKALLAGLSRDPQNGFLKSELEKLRKEDDGDQSPKRSRDGSDRELRAMQARTGETMTPVSPWPNKTFMAALIGDEKIFSEHFKPEDLKLRALEARLPLTIVVVCGAQRMRSGNPDRGTDGPVLQHAAVLRRLIEAGARMDSKDAAGWTALHHATAHHPVLDLAKILLEAGADVNMQDRFGAYPLVGAIMCAEVPSVRLLLRHGARADLKDNDGCDALRVCSVNSEMQSLVHKAHYHNLRPGMEKSCANCGKTGAKSGCAGCAGLTKYCSRECQQEHWPKHKEECRKITTAAGDGLPAEMRVRIAEDKESTTVTNLQAHVSAAMANLVGVAPDKAKRVDKRTATIDRDVSQVARSLIAAASKATKSNVMKVKIQVPMEPTPEQRLAWLSIGQSPDNMLLYNQDRSLMCQLDGSTPEAQQLTALVRKKGVMGLKGYFVVYFDDACKREGGVPREIVVRTAMLPPQPF